MSNTNVKAYPEALSIAPYERMRIALCLAAVGGFLEAYTFTLKGGVFANAQTGNLVTCAVRLAQRDPAAALRSLLPIVAFVLGIMLTERLKRLPHENTPEQWHCIVIVTELALLLIVTFLPAGLPDFATTLIVSFVCALQYGRLRQTPGLPHALLQDARSSLCDHLLHRQSAQRGHGAFQSPTGPQHRSRPPRPAVFYRGGGLFWRSAHQRLNLSASRPALLDSVLRCAGGRPDYFPVGLPKAQTVPERRRPATGITGLLILLKKPARCKSEPAFSNSPPGFMIVLAGRSSRWPTHAWSVPVL